jgi:plastocyanin
MKGLPTILNGMYLSFAILLLNSCNAPEKTVHKKYTVEIKQMQFMPAELTVQKGDTVVFVNKDFLVHNVTEETNKAWASDSLSTDDSFSKVIMESANYYCSLHPVMKGKLIVEQ